MDIRKDAVGAVPMLSAKEAKDMRRFSCAISVT